MRLPLLAWLFLTLSASAAHTMAWKVPLEFVVREGIENPLCRPLDHPPAQSAFFGAGDDLWDVSKAISWNDGDLFEPDTEKGSQQRFQGDWLVWNATSGRLVGRGSWVELGDLERGIDLTARPRLIRTQLEIHDHRCEPRKISIVTRSGESGSLRVSGIELDCMAIPDRTNRSIDLSVVASWAWGDEARDGIDLDLTLAAGEATPVARWRNTSGSWEARITTQVTTPDGTPVARLRQIETAGGLRWIDGHRFEQLCASEQHDPKRDDGPVDRSFHVAPDGCDRIVSGGGPYWPLSVELLFVSPRWEGWLLCRSGLKASIFRSRNGKSRDLLVAGPNVGPNNRLIDVIYELRPDETEHLASAATLSNGRPLDIAGSEKDGHRRTRTLTAKIIDPNE